MSHSWLLTTIFPSVLIFRILASGNLRQKKSPWQSHQAQFSRPNFHEQLFGRLLLRNTPPQLLVPSERVRCAKPRVEY
jgi:hypothetical protein